MKYPFKKMSFDSWEKKFSPILNHLDRKSAFDGLMFETYGKELDLVLTLANSVEADSLRVWTMVDGERGPVIIEGYHLVNRLGYFITSRPAEPGVQYNISC